MTSPAGFRHPALAEAAVRLQKLQQAAAQIGSPDPIAPLHYVDCAPERIKQMVAGVQRSAALLTRAQQQLDAGRRTADADWHGSGADAFDERAQAVDADHVRAIDATQRTAQAGMSAAEGLDDLARDAANQAISTAAGADSAADAVLAGDWFTAPGAQLEVNIACTNIVTMVQRHVAMIPAVTAGLATTADRALGGAAAESPTDPGHGGSTPGLGRGATPPDTGRRAAQRP